ncbi:unnamed protein product [Adineta steineri]|uniref:G-protein coupled receptors family 1 profile domain-containing protein n=1 Tax=Adineta steineri TaxID=433720 RepID=A0A813NZV8_9BILA|nr:unnamed protein product [Adineta steineri]CAF0763967.1 unnamed protein product [Adineta steineri]CAF3503093.1 unnamed protein product [Adineta steineri]CAF3680360.1 unnamed protein product [Adineta steineri]
MKLLETIPINLYVIGGPILLFIGTISCICNLIIFTRNNLRKNSCSICLIAFNLSSLFLLYFSFLPAILQIGYNIDPGSYNLIYCRIRYYLGFLFACLPSFYLILASIDRTLITSSNVRIRQWSNTHFIYKCLLFLTLFWTLFHIHALLYTNIIQIEPNHFVCYFNPGLYSILVSYYSLIVNGMIPPILLTIFGLLTMRNIHHSRSRISPSLVKNNSNIIHRKNQQLIRMLSTEILICIMINFIHPSVLLYEQITQNKIQDYNHTIINQFLISISTFILHIPYCLSFYTNLIVSKTFRTEVKHFIHKYY